MHQSTLDASRCASFPNTISTNSVAMVNVVFNGVSHGIPRMCVGMSIHNINILDRVLQQIVLSFVKRNSSAIMLATKWYPKPRLK